MSKGSEILSRIIGAGSMFAGMIFFGQMDHLGAYALPGIFFGVSGLWMVIRRGERHPALPDPEVQHRLAQLQELVFQLLLTRWESFVLLRSNAFTCHRRRRFHRLQFASPHL